MTSQTGEVKWPCLRENKTSRFTVPPLLAISKINLLVAKGKWGPVLECKLTQWHSEGWFSTPENRAYDPPHTEESEYPMLSKINTMY